MEAVFCGEDRDRAEARRELGVTVAELIVQVGSRKPTRSTGSRLQEKNEPARCQAILFFLIDKRPSGVS
jgi:hypothetical protein